jgi:hypothetical protein
LFSAELQRDNPKDYKRMIEQAGQKFAPAAGIVVRGQAVVLINPVTGNLKGSVTWRTSKEDGGFNEGDRANNITGTMITTPPDPYTVYVGTNVEYAEHVEYLKERGYGDRSYLRAAIDIKRKQLQKLFGEIFRREAGRG